MSDTAKAPVYVIAEAQALRTIDKLNHVCDRCGGDLSPIKTVDNANNPTHWIGCKAYEIFTGGTSKENRELAIRLIDERNFRDGWPEKWERDSDEGRTYYRNRQISKAVRMVEDVRYLIKTPKEDTQ